MLPPFFWTKASAESTSTSGSACCNSETFTALPLDARDAYNLARTSFTASFIDEGSTRDWIEMLDTAFGAA